MPLPPNTLLGRYEIRSKIGEGGMGEVYLAWDVRLERNVALKLLPAEVAQDEKRMGRFVQEAKAASALNHPNIITIYAIEQIDSTHFIATEFIDGETLRQHLTRARMTIPEAIDVAVQIASALAAAHEAGIVHRDIKPENIMLRRRDQIVKVLDFGLAKLTERQTSTVDTEAATQALVNTAPGVVMGTAAYMSPEQARGLEVDARADIWSLGVVIYEMATERLPFQGETASDVIAAILKTEPAPLTRFAPDAPPKLEEIVSKALEKDREERYQTVKDMLVDLRRLKKRLDFENELERSAAPQRTSGAVTTTRSADEEAATASLSRAQTAPLDEARSTSSAEYIINEIKRHKAGVALIIAALAIVAAGLTYGIYKFVGRKPAAGLQSLKITRLTNSGRVGVAVISPDGKYVAYSAYDEAGQSSLWVRHVATASNVQIVPPAGADVVFSNLTFSPDGNYIYYTRAEKNALPVLYQVPVLGGTSKKLLEDVGGPISFSPDGKRFAFIRRYAGQGQDALVLANADGTGEQKLAVRTFPDFFLGYAAWSPDGKTIACPMGGFTGGYYRSIAVVQVADGAQRPLTSHRWFNVERVAWLSDGSGVITTAQEQAGDPYQIWQISYPDGEARPLTNDLNTYHSASLTADSSALVAVLSDLTSNVWVAPAGDWAAARQLTSGKGNGGPNGGVAWTPDGRVVYRSLAGGSPDIWIMDADGRNQKQLTDDGFYKRSLFVSPDGRYVVFDSMRSGSLQIWRIDIDGGNPKQLTTGMGAFSPNCSPDGKWVVYGAFVSSGYKHLESPD